MSNTHHSTTALQAAVQQAPWPPEYNDVGISKPQKTILRSNISMLRLSGVLVHALRRCAHLTRMHFPQIDDHNFTASAVSFVYVY